jgi:DNA gyrase/topoisomerase IV subunit B
LAKDYTVRSGTFITSVNAIQMFDKKSVQIEGLVDAIKSMIGDLIEDKDLRSFFLSSYNLPLHLIALAWVDKASFQNQGKSSYKDKTFQDQYVKDITKQFKSFGSEYWDALYTLLSEDIESKYHKYNTKGMLLGGSMKNLAYRLNKPNSYCACRSKDTSKIELFIVEGDSAMTTIKQVCDREYQAIFAIDGKPINPFKKDIKTVRANTTYQDLIQVLGVSPGDKNLDNMNFHRIGLLSDADADGYHITSLVLGILYSINPLILIEGRVFLSTPPLYILSNNVKFKSLFIRDKRALMDARAEIAGRIIGLSMRCGKKEHYLDDEEFRSMYYLIHRIGVAMHSVAKRLAIDASILEMLMHCLPYLQDGVNEKAIEKKLSLDYCKYIPENNSLIMTEKAIEYVVPLTGVTKDIRAYIMPELGPLAFDQVDICVTTKLTDLLKNQSMTLTGIFNIFKNIDELFTTSRMKGLGQMPKPVLRHTCLDKSTRSFVTISSLGDVEQIYQVLGVDTQARKDLVSMYVAGEDDEFML